MKRTVFAILVFLSLQVNAACIVVPHADTARTVPSVRQVVVPAVLAGTGAAGLFGYWGTHVNLPVKDYMADLRGVCYCRIDDCFEYLPLAASVLLGLCREYREGWEDRVLLACTGAAMMGIAVNGLKYSVCEIRPDGSRRNSFPSGHTASTFLGAELIRMEYGNWWGAAAYSVALATGFLRMYNERHWLNDVLAGAGIGILSAKAAYWLLPWERRHLGKVSFLPFFAPDAEGDTAAGLTLAYSF